VSVPLYMCVRKQISFCYRLFSLSLSRCTVSNDDEKGNPIRILIFWGGGGLVKPRSVFRISDITTYSTYSVPQSSFKTFFLLGPPFFSSPRISKVWEYVVCMMSYSRFIILGENG